MTTDQLIHRCAEYLREAGVDTPEHDVKLIMADVLGCSPSDVESAAIMRTDVRALCAKYGRDDDAELVHTFKHMVCRRHAREPLQYIVGHAPFRYLDLKVGPGVSIPRQETELIAQDAIEWVTRHGIYSPRIVDLCAGSGALGLALATEIPGAQVWGVELSPQAAVWTRRNITQISRTYPDITANYHLEIADATCPITLAHLDGTVDVVVSNPPYVPQSQVPQQPEVRDFDPSLALYGGSSDGMLIPEQIIRRAYALLRPGGLFLMEHDISQPDRTVAFARASGFSDARTGADLTYRPRYLVATK